MSVRAPFLAAALLALLSAASCGNQGEGQRCDKKNGNDDCESGLVCIAASELVGANTSAPGAALCCPPDEKNATVEACYRASTLPGSDGGSTGGSSGTGGSTSTGGSGTGGSTVREAGADVRTGG